jgi:hypothetical protein
MGHDLAALPNRETVERPAGGDIFNDDVYTAAKKSTMLTVSTNAHTAQLN